jgi:hypothetical protein
MAREAKVLQDLLAGFLTPPPRRNRNPQPRLSAAQKRRCQELGITIQRVAAGYSIPGYGTTSRLSGVDDLIADIERSKRPATATCADCTELAITGDGFFCYQCKP